MQYPTVEVLCNTRNPSIQGISQDHYHLHDTVFVIVGHGGTPTIVRCPCTDKTGSIFLAGSYLVKAAVGENIDNETLGGATTHCEISGVTDYKAKDDKDALDRIKNIVGKIGDFEKAGLDFENDPKHFLELNISE